MKPVDFQYERPASVAEAVEVLSSARGLTKVMAGGQSLGPMMNLRLVKPQMLVDIRRIAELREVRDEGHRVSFGACITHAEFEDGKVADAGNGMLAHVASGIAYRAVRNRGTIGGSLAHADPAADWVTTLNLLDAELVVSGPKGERAVNIGEFMTSAFEIALADDEILTAIRLAKLSANARWGYYKFCRKTGEFAEAMAAVLLDEDRGIRRVVLGATETRPHVIADAGDLLSAPDRAHEVVADLPFAGDGYERKIHAVCLKRAIEQVIRK